MHDHDVYDVQSMRILGWSMAICITSKFTALHKIKKHNWNTNEEQVSVKMQLRIKLEKGMGMCEWKERPRPRMISNRWIHTQDHGNVLGFPTHCNRINSSGGASNFVVCSLDAWVKFVFDGNGLAKYYAIHAWNCGLNHFKRFTLQWTRITSQSENQRKCNQLSAAAPLF